MMYHLSFPPPGRLMNANHSQHWGPKMREVAEWRSAAKLYATNAVNRKEIPRGLGLSIVHFDLPVQSLKIRHDPSNYFPTVKACVDGFVDAGIWSDDSSNEVATTEPTLHLRSDNPNVVITITGAS